MIRLIGQAPVSTRYTPGSFEEFQIWICGFGRYQLDIETNVTPYWCNRELITIQFGAENTQWVLQWSELSIEQKQWIKEFLEDDRREKLIHNAQFEYIVLRFHGIEINNLLDTMVCEKIITGGIETETYGLSVLSYQYLGYELDKTEQTTFGDNILTENKVVYAAKDVEILELIWEKQMPKIIEWNLHTVLQLEMDTIPALGEMTFVGMPLDPEKWRANIELAQPLIDEAHKELNDFLLTDPKLNAKGLELRMIVQEDTFRANWNSHPQKRELLSMIWPELEGSTKPMLKKFQKTLENLEYWHALNDLIEKNYSGIDKILLRDYKEELLQKGFLIIAGTIEVNWNSVDQTLPLFQAVEPSLKALNKESLSKVIHPVFDALASYKESLKLLSTYGESFLEQHLEPDGRIRTEYNQLVSTGRLSSKSPNMQNIPANDKVGLRYRNAFYAPSGTEFVDSDYISAELVIIADISKDPVWKGAIKNGWDLHSICAELIFKDKWKNATDPGCTYYGGLWISEDGIEISPEKYEEMGFPVGYRHLIKQKCKCKGHKYLRNFSKTVDFGLAYGMSEFKLSRTMKNSLREAKKIMDDFFKAFPSIGATLKYLANFGIKNGWSKTPAPFFRKRWYQFWSYSKPNIEAHLSGVQYDKTLGSIGRQASNQPIQGACADITKKALVTIYKWVRVNGFKDRIRLCCQVHDQVTTDCQLDLITMWKPKLVELMESAALVVITDGSLKADVTVSKVWTK